MGAFKKATKQDLKLRLAIAGPAGAGKTYTALRIATAMGGPIAYIDTEHGSASKYADKFDFDVMEMRPPFHPERFVKGIKIAAQEGYKVVVIDSLSHAWNGTGGILELVEEASARVRGNSYAAWKTVTPIQNELIEAIVTGDIHIIACMRSKMEYAQSKDDKGYTKIERLGMAPVQREGFEYEFDVVIDMDVNHNGIVTKTRCPELTDKVFKFPGEDVAGVLMRWLTSGNAEQDVAKAKAGEQQPAEAAQRGVETRNGGQQYQPTSEAPKAPQRAAVQPEESFPNKAERKALSPEDAATIAKWQNARDAKEWAVMEKHCKNVDEAHIFWETAKKMAGGKYTRENMDEIHADFFRMVTGYKVPA